MGYTSLNSVNPNPPTNEPGRWQKTSSGTWVENPGYTGPKQPLPDGMASQDQNGATTYGTPLTATQGNANPGQADAFDPTNYTAMRDGGYDTDLTRSLFAAHGAQGGQWSQQFKTILAQASSNPAILATYTRKPGEGFDTWMQRLNAQFPGIAHQDNTGHWVDNLGTISGDKRAKAYIDHDSLPGANGLTPAQQEAKDKADLGSKDQKEFQDFLDGLTHPISLDDPEAQRIMQLASGKASDQARLQGVQGPMSIANSQRATTDGLSQYDLQRKQLGLSGLEYKGTHSLDNAKFEYGKLNDQFEHQYQGSQDTLGMIEAANKNSAYSGNTGKIIGTVAGGVFGGIIGGPGGATAGASLGGGLGGGVDSMVSSQGSGLNSGGYLPPNPTKYGGI